MDTSIRIWDLPSARYRQIIHSCFMLAAWSIFHFNLSFIIIYSQRGRSVPRLFTISKIESYLNITEYVFPCMENFQAFGSVLKVSLNWEMAFNSLRTVFFAWKGSLPPIHMSTGHSFSEVSRTFCVSRALVRKVEEQFHIFGDVSRYRRGKTLDMLTVNLLKFIET